MRHRPQRQLLIGAGAVIYVTLAAASAFLITNQTDLDISFWPSATFAAQGHLLDVYYLGGHSAYPNANGPLSLVPLTLLAWIAIHLGFAGQHLPVTALVTSVFSIFTLLLAYEAARIVTHVRKSYGTYTRLGWFIAAALLFGPPLWLAMPGFGHVEMPLELWLMLLGVRLMLQGRRSVLAGIAFGLAILARSTALLYLIPITVFAFPARRRTAVAIPAAALLTAAAGLAPFLATDAGDVIHSLVTFRGDLPIRGGTFWYAVRNTPLGTVAQHADALITAVVITIICVAVQRVRSNEQTAASRLLCLLAIAAAAFPMLAKATLSYYLLEPYVFSVLWFAVLRRAPFSYAVAVPLLVLAATLVADMGVDVPLVVSATVQGIITSALLAAAIVLLAFWPDSSRTLPRRQLAAAARPAVVAGEKAGP